MNLIIDIGNTLTKVAIFNGYEIVRVDKYQVLTLDLLEEVVSNYSINRTILSAVGELPREIPNYLRGLTEYLFFTNSTPIPITNGYRTPGTLGPDRLAGAIGAHFLFPNKPVLAVDAGTTITYDIVTPDGVYRGGAISPGISIRFRSLKDYTKKLPLLSPADSFDLVGDDTPSCIQAGILSGVIHEVDGYIDRLKQRFESLAVVFTGGDTFFFEKKLKNSIFVNPNLVLLGLNRILNHNA